MDPGEILVFPRVGLLTVMAAIAQSPVWRWRVVVRRGHRVGRSPGKLCGYREL